MAKEIILLLLIVVAGTGGELCVARTMQAIGPATDIRPAALIRLLHRVLRIGWMWLGLSLMALAFFSLLEMLSLENVSFVVPVTALSYGFGALGGKVFLREQVTGRRWAGVLLVCIGVGLVLIGKR
jgi:multidrug transporter EmrE-like cation transporter